MRRKSNFSTALKAKVGCAALRESKSVNELSSEYGIHQTQINKWRKVIVESSATLFELRDSQLSVAKTMRNAIYCALKLLRPHATATSNR